MIRYVLFDFDGTLVDSRAVFIDTFNTLAERHGFNKIGLENLDHLKKLSMTERFRYLKVPLYKIPILTQQFLKRYRNDIMNIHFIEGVELMLNHVVNSGVNIGILSSNASETIQAFLRHQGVSGISDIYCSSKLFGKDRVFKKFLREKKLAATEVLYVCDELRDIHACAAVGIQPVWVSWGFELKEVMPSNGLLTVDRPEELSRVIESVVNGES